MEKYTLDAYAHLLRDVQMLEQFYKNGEENIPITYLTYDSKRVVEGTLFICKGAAFRAEYLDEAIEKGAVAYVSEVRYDTKKDVPYILTKDIRAAMPILAETFFHAPWKELTVVGIGGTKGKSTTTYYTKAIVDDYMKSVGGKESAVLPPLTFMMTSSGRNLI